MQIDYLGIHESVKSVFPPTELQRCLAEMERGLTIEVVSDELEYCNALVTHSYKREFIESNISWLHSIQSGVDQFPFNELKESGVILTNSTGIHSASVGETVMGYMLMFARLLHRYRWSQRDRTWHRPTWNEPFTLDGSSICIVGLGSLGMGIAERASALGMNVTAVKREVKPIEVVDTMHSSTDLTTAIANVDFVVLAVPLTEETEGLIGTAELNMMREDAYLINVARGPIIDQPSLVAALQNDELAGAALDVFETEPLPEDSPVYGMENVVVTPHTAAHTRDYYRSVADIIRENIAYLADEAPMTNRVV